MSGLLCPKVILNNFVVQLHVENDVTWEKNTKNKNMLNPICSLNTIWCVKSGIKIRSFSDILHARCDFLGEIYSFLWQILAPSPSSKT